MVEIAVEGVGTVGAPHVEDTGTIPLSMGRGCAELVDGTPFVPPFSLASPQDIPPLGGAVEPLTDERQVVTELLVLLKIGLDLVVGVNGGRVIAAANHLADGGVR